MVRSHQLGEPCLLDTTLTGVNTLVIVGPELRHLASTFSVVRITDIQLRQPLQHPFLPQKTEDALARNLNLILHPNYTSYSNPNPPNPTTISSLPSCLPICEYHPVDDVSEPERKVGAVPGS